MLLQLTFLVAIATPLLQADIKILETPAHKSGPEPCSRICSGVSWLGKNEGVFSWKTSGLDRNKLMRPNDMRDCGFVSAPLVTAIAGGRMCPSISVYFIDRDRFDVYTVEDTTLYEIKVKECNIYWTASGFFC